MTQLTPLYIASANCHKIAELTALLDGRGFDVRGLKDFPDYVQPPETGTTFHENARIKAHALRDFLRRTAPGAKRMAILADDSGLECDDLGGAPGITSARFAGDNATDDDNNAKLISAISSLPHPLLSARYVCALVFIRPDGTQTAIEATCEGRIVFTPSGCNGFGYDPHFYLPELDKTMAELGPTAKNRISHRGKALRELLATTDPFHN